MGVAAVAMGGVVLGGGIRLIEVAQAAAPGASSTAGAAGAAAGAAAGTAAGGAAPSAAPAGANAAVRWGLLIDSGKCVEGCTDCVSACNSENGLAAPARLTDAQWIRKVELKDLKTARKVSLPVMCQHCADPPCVDVCPTGASFKRADGIVLVDPHTCIGCRYCVMACPYQARSFVHENLSQQKPDVPRGKGCVESCTLCVHRIDAAQAAGGQANTACAEACTQAGHGAIVFGDLNDPASAISLRLRGAPSSQLRADLRLDQGVSYRGL